MDEQEHERLVAAVRAYGFVMQGLAAQMLMAFPDPVAAARELKATCGDRFTDALPDESWMPAEKQVRLNHLSAHFAETFWERVAVALERQR